VKIIDRYVLKAYVGVFLGSMAAISFLFIVLGVLDSMAFLTSEGMTIAGVVRYNALQLPNLIYMAAPIGALLSAMITLAGFNQSNELMALRASGVSVARVTAPILAATLCIAGMMFWLGSTWVPEGNRKFMSARQQFLDEDDDPSELVWYVSESRDRPPIILRAEKVDRESGNVKGLTVLTPDANFQLKEQLVAQSATHAREGGWTLHGVQSRTFQGFDTPRFMTLSELPLDLPDRPEDLLRVQRSPEEMTWSELIDQIQRSRADGLPKHPYQVELHARLAVPLAALVLVLVGTPLAVRPARSGGIAWALLAAVVIGFAYFIIIAELISIGKGGMVEPWVAAWTANIIFGVLGVGSFSTLRK